MQYRKYDTSSRKLKTNASTVRHLGLLNNSGKKEKANSDSSQEDLAHKNVSILYNKEHLSQVMDLNHLLKLLTFNSLNLIIIINYCNLFSQGTHSS